MKGNVALHQRSVEHKGRAPNEEHVGAGDSTVPPAIHPQSISSLLVKQFIQSN